MPTKNELVIRNSNNKSSGCHNSTKENLRIAFNLAASESGIWPTLSFLIDENVLGLSKYLDVFKIKYRKVGDDNCPN